jgi:hypothetical protein
MAGKTDGAAKYKFNNFQEIKSHSSILYNERMAILFYLLDMKNLLMHNTKRIETVYEVHSVLLQIFKNIRMLLRYNPTVRATMNINTKIPGVYTIDVAMGMLKKMLEYSEVKGFTERNLNIIIDELDSAEMLIKDILQYFHYFIRPDFRQKPDIDVATERYNSMADNLTIDELKEVVGKNHSIDFEALGSERIELENNSAIEYDVETDGPLSEYEDENDEIELIDDESD